MAQPESVQEELQNEEDPNTIPSTQAEPIQVELFGLPTCIYLIQRGPSFESSQLQALQNRLGTFPPDYLYFLKKYNGGITDFSSLILNGSSVNGVEHYFSVQEIDTLTQDGPHVFPGHCIPVGEDGSSNFYYLYLKGDTAGALSFYDADAYLNEGSHVDGKAFFHHFYMLAAFSSRMRIPGDGKSKPKGVVTSNNYSRKRVDGENAQFEGVETQAANAAMEGYDEPLQHLTKGQINDMVEAWQAQAQQLPVPPIILQTPPSVVIQGKDEPSSGGFLSKIFGKKKPKKPQGPVIFFIDLSPDCYVTSTGAAVAVRVLLSLTPIRPEWGYERVRDILTADLMASEKFNMKIDPVFRHNNGLFWEYGPDIGPVRLEDGSTALACTMMLIPKKLGSIVWGGLPHPSGAYKIIQNMS